MRKNLKKLALPAIAAAGAVMGAYSVASADIVVSITENLTNSGGFDVYTLAVYNNGLNGTGTNVNAIDMKLNYTGSGYIKMDNAKTIDGDTAPDINLLGASDAFGTTIGTFLVGPASVGSGSTYSGYLVNSADALQGDYENHIADSGSQWSSKAQSAAGHGRAYNTIFNSLTNLEIDGGLNLSGGGVNAGYHVTTAPAEDFANIVVPHGGAFVVQGSVAAPQFNSKSVAALSYIFTEGITTAAPSGPIVLLQTATPTNTGAQIHNGSGGTTGAPLGAYNPGAASSTLTVTNTGPGGYLPGYINGLTTGLQAGYTATTGFSGTDLEIYLLNLKYLSGGAAVSSADDAKLVSDINADNAGVTASLVSNPQLATLGGIAWSIELNFSGVTGSNANLLGFNFVGETDLSGAVEVTDIAAIPEPATAGLLMVGGLGLLARRRRSAK